MTMTNRYVITYKRSLVNWDVCPVGEKRNGIESAKRLERGVEFVVYANSLAEATRITTVKISPDEPWDTIRHTAKLISQGDLS